jgi:hypothetical protein
VNAGPAAQTLGVASDIELLIFDGTTPLPGLPAGASMVGLSAVLSAIPVTAALVAALTADGADCDDPPRLEAENLRERSRSAVVCRPLGALCRR